MGSRINFEMVHDHLAAFEQLISKIHYNLENQIQLNQFERCYFSNETDRRKLEKRSGDMPSDKCTCEFFVGDKSFSSESLICLAESETLFFASM